MILLHPSSSIKEFIIRTETWRIGEKFKLLVLRVRDNTDGIKEAASFGIVGVRIT